MSDEIKLLPCPFCGGNNATILGNGMGDYYVLCGNPLDSLQGCWVRTLDIHCESKAQSAERWNRRAVTASSGAERIAQERQRQITIEGWSVQNDDGYVNGELLCAALAYLLHEHEERGHSQAAFDEWPWDPEWFKAGPDRIRNLEKAGALIAAEIDRCLRAQKGGAK